MTRLLRDTSLDDLRARHPALFSASPLRRIIASAIVAFMAGLFAYGIWRLDITWSRLLSGVLQIGWFIGLMIPPTPGEYLALYVNSMIETLAIALLGTLLAAILAFPYAMLVAQNIVPVWIVRFVGRRFLDAVRGVDTLIWALIWIGVVGLGPFAGVLAIGTSDFGALGKLFAEAIETADRRAVEGVRSVGGTRAQEIRFALLPQVFPLLVGQFLYYFESNTRSATIIGIVGAGGIGLHLSEQIRTLEWPRVAFIVLMILVVVAVIDWGSSRIRHAIMGRAAA